MLSEAGSGRRIAYYKNFIKYSECWPGQRPKISKCINPLQIVAKYCKCQVVFRNLEGTMNDRTAISQPAP